MYRLKDSIATNLTVTVSGNVSSYILKNLKQGQTYVIQVSASNSIGMGPYSEAALAVTAKGGLREPEGPFYQRIWFIVILVVVCLLLIVAIVLLILVIRYKRTHRRTAGKYHGEDLRSAIYSLGLASMISHMYVHKKVQYCSMDKTRPINMYIHVHV